ncbi:MAG: hypothetical protein ACT6RD_06040 [Brevundimonas sp.]|uniref:hypothetical protein n=1 Tax=Brevundimonas sp. TaxID=1871086 RepID=UPI0040340EEF
MLEFTALEQAVFKATCEAQPEIAASLGKLLKTARVLDRENTGHGFYTSFDADRSKAPLEWPSTIVDGPDAEVEVCGEALFMGFILSLKDGYPAYLEGFQYCTPSGGHIDLKSAGLEGIKWIRPMPAP